MKSTIWLEEDRIGRGGQGKRTCRTLPLIMKQFPSALFALAILCVPCSPGHAESVLLEDDFDHYPLGDAPYSGIWPDGMSGSGEVWDASGKSVAWTSEGAPLRPDGQTAICPRRIVEAPGGRAGQAFCYSESSETDRYPNITARFAPYGDVDEHWQVTLDFYIERLSAPLSQGGMGLVDVRKEPYEDAEGKPGWTLVSQVFLADDMGAAAIVFVLADAPGDTPRKISESVEPGQWHRLKIVGSNREKTLKYFLDDVERASGFYVIDQASIGSISIGDVNPYGKTFVEPGSSVVLDNFKFERIPPSGKP